MPPDPDWSALPADAIRLISTILPNDADYVRLRSLCTSWRSAAPKRPQPPWLILTSNDRLKLRNFPKPDLFTPVGPLISVDTVKDHLICGSSRGWLAILDGSPRITLHNPLTGAHIPLPVITDFPSRTDGLCLIKSDDGFSLREGTGSMGEVQPLYWFGNFMVKKTILSSDPLTDDCVVVSLCYRGSCLIHCRPGSASWSGLSHDYKVFEDIVFYKGKLYAVAGYEVYVCDSVVDGGFVMVSPSDDEKKRDKPSGSKALYMYSYLVVSCGDLLLVAIRHGARDEILSCEVFRVDLEEDGKLGRLKMENLGGRSLFLGKESMSVSASDSPWFRGNCIYFTDTSSTTRVGPGPTTLVTEFHGILRIFCMEDSTTTTIPDVLDNMWGPHWFMPSLCS